MLLRPLGPGDSPTLLQWAAAMRPHHPLAARAPFTLFPDVHWQVTALVGSSMVLMVLDLQSKPLGCATIFEANPFDAHAHIDLFVTSNCPPVVRLEAWLLGIDHVFAWFPITKLYRRLPDYEDVESKIAAAQGFEEEGCLVSHIWFEGQHHDLRILALSRERWSHRRDVFVDNIEIQARSDAIGAAH